MTFRDQNNIPSLAFGWHADNTVSFPSTTHGSGNCTRNDPSLYSEEEAMGSTGCCPTSPTQRFIFMTLSFVS